MDLINCRECGKLFSSSGQKVCPDCRQSEEEKFQLVKEYLWENPNSTVKKVSAETGVEEELIIKFMREERLASEGLVVDYSLKCKRCGTEIKSGLFCKSCRTKMISGFNQSDDPAEERKSKSEKMFLKDRFKRNK
ncbi:flagellar protein [Halanaerobium saccharolyticum]|uniref:flagellar protein n=1 Tax=Halanaerobium saccharolyticum TaxID=43595 RepID=UPI003FCDDEF4